MEEKDGIMAYYRSWCSSYNQSWVDNFLESSRDKFSLFMCPVAKRVPYTVQMVMGDSVVNNYFDIKENGDMRLICILFETDAYMEEYVESEGGKDRFMVVSSYEVVPLG